MSSRLPPERNPNLYGVLGLAFGASIDVVKKAYKGLALKYHPDKNRGGDEAVAEEKFKEVSEAYQVLGNEERKGKYDQRFDPRSMESFYATVASGGLSAAMHGGGGGGSSSSTQGMFSRMHSASDRWGVNGATAAAEAAEKELERMKAANKNRQRSTSKRAGNNATGSTAENTKYTQEQQDFFKQKEKERQRELKRKMEREREEENERKLEAIRKAQADRVEADKRYTPSTPTAMQGGGVGVEAPCRVPSMSSKEYQQQHSASSPLHDGDVPSFTSSTASVSPAMMGVSMGTGPYSSIIMKGAGPKQGPAPPRSLSGIAPTRKTDAGQSHADPYKVPRSTTPTASSAFGGGGGGMTSPIHSGAPLSRLNSANGCNATGNASGPPSGATSPRGQGQGATKDSLRPGGLKGGATTPVANRSRTGSGTGSGLGHQGSASPAAQSTYSHNVSNTVLFSTRPATSPIPVRVVGGKPSSSPMVHAEAASPSTLRTPPPISSFTSATSSRPPLGSSSSTANMSRSLSPTPFHASMSTSSLEGRGPSTGGSVDAKVSMLHLLEVEEEPTRRATIMAKEEPYERSCIASAMRREVATVGGGEVLRALTALEEPLARGMISGGHEPNARALLLEVEEPCARAYCSIAADEREGWARLVWYGFSARQMSLKATAQRIGVSETCWAEKRAMYAKEAAACVAQWAEPCGRGALIHAEGAARMDMLRAFDALRNGVARATVADRDVIIREKLSLVVAVEQRERAVLRVVMAESRARACIMAEYRVALEGGCEGELAISLSDDDSDVDSIDLAMARKAPSQSTDVSRSSHGDGGDEVSIFTRLLSSWDNDGALCGEPQYIWPRSDVSAGPPRAKRAVARGSAVGVVGGSAPLLLPLHHGGLHSAKDALNKALFALLLEDRAAMGRRLRAMAEDNSRLRAENARLSNLTMSGPLKAEGNCRDDGTDGDLFEGVPASPTAGPPMMAMVRSSLSPMNSPRGTPSKPYVGRSATVGVVSPAASDGYTPSAFEGVSLSPMTPSSFKLRLGSAASANPPQPNFDDEADGDGGPSALSPTPSPRRTAHRGDGFPSKGTASALREGRSPSADAAALRGKTSGGAPMGSPARFGRGGGGSTLGDGSPILSPPKGSRVTGATVVGSPSAPKRSHSYNPQQQQQQSTRAPSEGSSVGGGVSTMLRGGSTARNTLAGAVGSASANVAGTVLSELMSARASTAGASSGVMGSSGKATMYAPPPLSAGGSYSRTSSSSSCAAPLGSGVTSNRRVGPTANGGAPHSVVSPSTPTVPVPVPMTHTAARQTGTASRSSSSNGAPRDASATSAAGSVAKAVFQRASTATPIPSGAGKVGGLAAVGPSAGLVGGRRVGFGVSASTLAANGSGQGMGGASINNPPSAVQPLLVTRTPSNQGQSRGPQSRSSSGVKPSASR